MFETVSAEISNPYNSLNLIRDISCAHPKPIERDDLVLNAENIRLMLFYNLRLKPTISVSRH